MKLSVLFVDDDNNLISGLKRSLRIYARDWELYFATSGQEALEILSGNRMDVIVTDIRMGGMDGIQLLEKVIERHPQVTRLVLSAYTDREVSIKSSHVAHQFIAKPCDTHKLVQTIKNIQQLREFQSDPQLVKIITSIKRLPSLPSLYLQLVQKIETPQSSSKTIADIIEMDITMTAKTLQLVNSAFYGLPAKVSNLQQAITILGTDTLKALVLTQRVFSQYTIDQEVSFSLDNLWKHSIAVGNLGRTIMRNLGFGREMQDDAQVGGVMHDIGKLIHFNIPDFISDWTGLINQGVAPLSGEYALLGTSHAELGAYMLGIWGLPASIVQAVGYHHFPVKVPEKSILPLTAVHVANGIISDTTDGKHIDAFVDMTYLDSLNLAGKMGSWLDLYKSMRDKGQLSAL
jgi:putative nucleotidyltransferase with HDIG domain